MCGGGEGRREERCCFMSLLRDSMSNLKSCFAKDLLNAEPSQNLFLSNLPAFIQCGTEIKLKT